VAPPDYPEPDKSAIDDRAGLAINGGVPAVYADSRARLNCRKPLDVTEAKWRQALDDAGRFLDEWGAVAAACLIARDSWPASP